MTCIAWGIVVGACVFAVFSMSRFAIRELRADNARLTSMRYVPSPVVEDSTAQPMVTQPIIVPFPVYQPQYVESQRKELE